jgi:hypothetical protein
MAGLSSFLRGFGGGGGASQSLRLRMSCDLKRPFQWPQRPSHKPSFTEVEFGRRTEPPPRPPFEWMEHNYYCDLELHTDSTRRHTDMCVSKVLYYIIIIMGVVIV